MNRMIMGLATVTLFACGGAGETESQREHHGEHHAGGEHHGGGDDHPGLPPAVDNFHTVLGPIWHAEEGDTRRGLACDADNLHDLDSAAAEVKAMSIPAGADEGEWHAAADGLAASVDAVMGACEAGGDEAEARLAEVHQAFHVVADLAGHDRDAVPDSAAEAQNVTAHEEGEGTEEADAVATTEAESEPAE
jgi:hypothetical protein